MELLLLLLLLLLLFCVCFDFGGMTYNYFEAFVSFNPKTVLRSR